MTLSQAYLLANDSEFRVLAGFTSPPRAATVTALEPSGQVRLALDDADGADVLAWPLNGFVYSVGDVVYVLFAANSPESAIVLGAKAPLPTLDGAVFAHDHTDKVARDGSTPLTADWDIGDGRKLKADKLAARDAAGLRLEDDGGNLGVFIKDGGNLGFSTTDIEATTADFKTAQLGAGGLIMFGAGSNLGLWYTSNAYYDGAWKRRAAGKASMVTMTNGALYLSTAPTGAADSAITWKDTILDENGNLGLGITAQGRLHAHDGVGGFVFVTKTGIDGTAQTILPNATGDITRALAFLIAISDGSTGGGAMNFLFPGGNQDFGVGTLTVRLACAADGSLTVKRQAGTATATIALLGVWV